MKTSKLLIIIAMLMFAAKPFVGFSLRYQQFFRKTHASNILVKSFTKRKVEETDNKEVSLEGIQKQLANPALPAFVLFTFALTALFPFVFKNVKVATNSFLLSLQYRLAPPDALYMLTGKLTI